MRRLSSRSGRIWTKSYEEASEGGGERVLCAGITREGWAGRVLFGWEVAKQNISGTKDTDKKGAVEGRGLRL